MPEEEIQIFIDGSAITNPGSIVGCAGIVCYPESFGLPNKELRWSYSLGTSGGMEVMALVNALKWVHKNKEFLDKYEVKSIRLLSDSQYIVNAANHWIYQWSKNKWKKTDGGSVKHHRLWKEFLREKKKIHFHIYINWIEGKSTQETKKVDKAAKKAAKSRIKKPNFEQLPYKLGRSLLGKTSKLELLSEIGQTHPIRVYSHCLVARKRSAEYEVRFEIIKDDCIEGKFKAFTSQSVGFKNIDRGHYYYATFSDNVIMPWISEIKEIEGVELELLKEKVKTIQIQKN